MAALPDLALLEVPVSLAVHRLKMRRWTASALVGGIVFALGVPSAMSFGVLSHIRIGRYGILDAIDAGVSNFLLPVGGVLVVFSVPILDKLKIDHVFVRRLAHDKSSQAVSEAILAMGRSLSLDVVGEGVETQQSLDYMRAHGCSQVQGNWFTRPLPPAAFQRWYRRHLKADKDARPLRH